MCSSQIFDEYLAAHVNSPEDFSEILAESLGTVSSFRRAQRAEWHSCSNSNIILAMTTLELHWGQMVIFFTSA